MLFWKLLCVGGLALVKVVPVRPGARLAPEGGLFAEGKLDSTSVRSMSPAWPRPLAGLAGFLVFADGRLESISVRSKSPPPLGRPLDDDEVLACF